MLLGVLDGTLLGCTDVEGWSLASMVGLSLGIVDCVGLKLGPADVEGWRLAAIVGPTLGICDCVGLKLDAALGLPLGC